MSKSLPKLYEVIEISPGQHKLVINPHPGQWRVLNSDKRFVFMLAGAQSGKTSLGPIWLHGMMQKFGNGDYLVVSPSFPLQNMKLIPEYINYFTHTLGIGKYKAGKRIMEIEGSGLKATIFFGSADNPDSLESATAKAAHLDEVGQDNFRLSAWEAIQRRLSLNQGHVLGTTTLYNLGWMKREIYDAWERGDPDIDVIQFDSIENPNFPRAEYERMKRILPGWKFDMFYRGRYARPAGMIYSDFDESVHVIPEFPIPPKWKWHVSIDPGAVNTAVLWFAEDPTLKIYYIVRSYLDGNKTTREHVLKARKFPEFDRVKRWVGGAKSEVQFRLDWNAEGINVREPEIHDVEQGIDRVIALWKENRLFILNTDTNRPLIDEIGIYSRELDEFNDPTEKIKDKNTFHLCDGLRYFAAGTSSGANPKRFLNIVSRRFRVARRRWRKF